MNTFNGESQNPHPSDLREKFRARLIALGLPPKTHPYLENRAESFMKARAYLDAEKTYCQWISSYLNFTLQNQDDSPETLGPDAITPFLNHLVLKRNVAVHLPLALQRKYPNAPLEFTWSFLFPGIDRKRKNRTLENWTNDVDLPPVAPPDEGAERSSQTSF